MSETQQDRTGGDAARRQRETTGWVGWVFFAGIMMIMLGSFHAIAGLVALFKDDYYLVTNEGLVVSLDYSAWGWVHIILGLVVAAAGFAVMKGQMWGRVTGIVLAGFSALVNLVFLAAYPVWSVIAITLGVLVIYALVVHGSEAKSYGY